VQRRPEAHRGYSIIDIPTIANQLSLSDVDEGQVNRASVGRIGLRKTENNMADDISLAHGIIVILRKCFELSQTEDDAELRKYAEKLLAGIKAGELEMALRKLAGDAQLQLDGMVNDNTCREVVQRVRKLVIEN